MFSFPPSPSGDESSLSRDRTTAGKRGGRMSFEFKPNGSMGSLAMWVQKNIREIAEDPVLRIYGALLAATHVFTFQFWHGSSDLATVLGPGAEPICWPFWEDCWQYRFHDMAQLEMLLWGYLGLSL